MKIFFSCALAFVLSLFCFPSPKITITKVYNQPIKAETIISGLKWKGTPGAQGKYMYYTYLGEFPQTHVGGGEAEELDVAYDEELRDRDNTSNKLTIEEEVSIYDRSFTIVTYNDCKYALFIQSNANDANTNVSYNDGTGDYIKTGGYNWFKFEPIKWYALTPTDPSTLPNGTEVPVICDKALFCNVPYVISSQVLGYTEQINFNYSHLKIMLKRLLPFTGLEKHKDLLIKAVPHALSWEENDDVISYEAEDGDLIYPASKREINVTYSNYYSYFIPQASDFTFALAVDQESKTNTVINRQTKQMLGYHTRTAVDTRQPLIGGTSGQFTPNPNPTPLIYSLYQSRQYENEYTFQSYFCMGGKGLGFVPMMTILTEEYKEINVDERDEFDKYVSSLQDPSNIECDAADSKTIHIKTFEGWKVLHTYTQKNDIGSPTTSYKLVLDNNIDCRGEELSPIGRVYADFDGQGYAVANLNILGSLSHVRYDGSMAHNPIGVENPDSGIFQYAAAGHTFENVKFLNIYVTGGIAGGIIGKIFATNASDMSTYKPFTFKNIFFYGTVTSSYVKSQTEDINSFRIGTQNIAGALAGEADAYMEYTGTSHYTGQAQFKEGAVDINVENCEVHASLSCEQLDRDGAEIYPSVYATSFGGNTTCSYTDSSGPHYGVRKFSTINIQNSCFDIIDVNGGGVNLKNPNDSSAPASVWFKSPTKNLYYGTFDPSVWFCSSALYDGVPLLKAFYFLGDITSTADQLLKGLTNAGFTKS